MGKGSKGDIVFGLDINFIVEWVHANGGDGEEGLAFKGNFWGKGALDARSPDGIGKDSAEVWFEAIRDDV